MRSDQDEVLVWRIRSDGELAARERAGGVLSLPELARADRFRRATDRDMYICSHAALRRILARCLECDPRNVDFVQKENGKPALIQARGSPLDFNLSHSADLALVAVARGRPVGVDVEKVVERAGLPDIADRFFSSREANALRALPDNLRTLSFLRLWTRKEAYLKACGLGLAGPLNSFEVTADESDDLLGIRSTDGSTCDVWLKSIDVGAGYVAAVASQGHGWRVSVRDWSQPAF